MEPVVFSMAGDPRPKGRPRATVRGEFATIYTDTKTRKYERSISVIARAAMGSADPLEGALSVSIRFRLPIPKSMSKRQRAAILAGEIAYLGSGDLDNLAKAVLDACNAIVYLDDKQIVRLWLTKVASDKPGIDFRCEPLEPQPSSATTTTGELL